MNHPLQVGWLLLCLVASGAGAEGALQIVQHGRVIEPVDGEVTLDRTLFAVRGAPGSGALSVYVTSDDAALGSAQSLWAAPVVAPLGASSAARPYGLGVDSVGLEFYRGVTDTFAATWADVLGPAQLDAFKTLRDGLPREPHLLMSPRQHAGASARSDGAQQLAVVRLGADPIASAPVDRVTLFAFFEHSADSTPAPAGQPQGHRPPLGGVATEGSLGSALWSVIGNIETVRIRLRQPAAAQSIPLPDPLPGTDPDCGAGSLVRAVRNADWQRVERLMAQGVGPNQKIGRRGATLLSCAVSAAPVHAASVMLLLERDGDLGARTARAETPLMWAVKGAEGGRFEASRADIVTQFIARGADVNATDIEGDTVLHHAVSSGVTEVVALLLAAGADPGALDRVGLTPLTRAQGLGYTEIAELLQLYLE